MLQLDEMLRGVRYLGQIPRFLRQPLGADEVWSLLHRRFERRAADFLSFLPAVSSAGPPTNHPYRRLLALSTCEYQDVEKLVDGKGAEGALQAPAPRADSSAASRPSHRQRSRPILPWAGFVREEG